MRLILFSSGLALAIAILLTPFLIKVFARRGFGQEIRQEGPITHQAKRGTPTMGGVGPITHQAKRGTPTMGGVAIIAALWGGYFGAHAFGWALSTEADPSDGPSASALLVLGLTTALAGVGFLDDFIKLRKQRNLGLNKTAKLVGQLVVAVVFAVLALRFRDADGLTPATDQLSFTRDIATVSFGALGFVLFAYLLVSAWSNAVNLTDGLDGLAAGAMALVLATYVLISFWQYSNDCTVDPAAGCYEVRDPLDLGILAAAAMGGCIGFLWWNAAPAKIFMGDTGSLALGGMLAGLSMVTRTELLLVVIGALFVVEAMSVVVQVAVFRTSRRRVFRMAPFHHHFELGGWAETTVIIRFWLLAGISCALGAALFYSEWLASLGG